MGGVAADQSGERNERHKDDARTYTDYASSPVRSARAGTAGILLLIIVIFVAIDMAITVFVVSSVTGSDEYEDALGGSAVARQAFGNMVACQSIRLMFLAMTVFGAVASMRRMHFGLAIAGSAFAILCLGTSVLALVMGFWMLMSFALFVTALVALGFIISARREFDLA